MRLPRRLVSLSAIPRSLHGERYEAGGLEIKSQDSVDLETSESSGPSTTTATTTSRQNPCGSSPVRAISTKD